MFKSKIKEVSLILIALLLTSCGSNISKKWSCRNTDSKLGCVSISDADDAYNSELNSNNQSLTKTLKSNSNKYSSFNINNAGNRLIRTSDKVGRVWIAPYLDGNGNWHEASYIRTIDEISKWEIRKKEIYRLEKDNLSKNNKTND